MTRWSKTDFLRRHQEALKQRKPMRPPVNRVKLLHEEECAA